MNVASVNPALANQVALIQRKLKLERTLAGSSNWFFWIAGLSIINSIIYLAGGKLNFIFGLGITQVVDGFTTALAKGAATELGALVHAAGLGFDIGLAGLFVGAGILGRKRYRWAIVTGMILYLLDGLIFLFVADWLNIAFHAFALFALAGSLKAINDLTQLEKNGVPDVPLSTLVTAQKLQEDSSRRTLLLALGIIVVFTIFLFVLMGIFLSIYKP